MKKGLCLSVALACVFFADTAFAGKIGFINDPELARKSTALQGLQMQREKMLGILKADLDKEAGKILEQKQKLEEEKTELSNEELGKRLDSIGREERNLQQRAQNAAAELQKNFVEAALSFKEKAINPVVLELAKEKNFDAVLNAADAFYVDEELNVTDEAIKRVNKKMPKLDLKKVSLEKTKKSK